MKSVALARESDALKPKTAQGHCSAHFRTVADGRIREWQMENEGLIQKLISSLSDEK